MPFFGTIRIGQFRQPGTMDGWTTVRHLEFLERSLPFQALDPFRRVGIMAYSMSEDERTMWAYSVYGTGLTFFNGTGTTYSTLGDTRAGTQIGDSGGVAFTSRLTHLLYYDELSQGRYLLHIGGGYSYSQIGGERHDGLLCQDLQLAADPGVLRGRPGRRRSDRRPARRSWSTRAGFWPAASTSGTPSWPANYGSAHFQTEFMCDELNQRGGPAVFYPAPIFSAAIS